MIKQKIDIKIEKNNTEKAREIYKKILERFPEIQENNTEINFVDQKYFLANFSIYDKDILKEKREVVKRPILHIGPKLLEMPEEEQEAVLSHELGHYLDNKDYDIYHIEEMILNKFKLTIGRKKFPEDFERLKKWSLEREIGADNHAIRVGCGKALLKILEKKIKDKKEGYEKEEVRARIKNIKNKLSF